eukprot:12367925-Alexandrium_andersonii.AAC.1
MRNLPRNEACRPVFIPRHPVRPETRVLRALGGAGAPGGPRARRARILGPLVVVLLRDLELPRNQAPPSRVVRLCCVCLFLPAPRVARASFRSFFALPAVARRHLGS